MPELYDIKLIVFTSFKIKEIHFEPIFFLLSNLNLIRPLQIREGESWCQKNSSAYATGCIQLHALMDLIQAKNRLWWYLHLSSSQYAPAIYAAKLRLKNSLEKQYVDVSR